MLLVPSSWFVVVALHSGHTTKKINLTIKGRMLECSPLLSLHSIPEVKSRQMPNQQKNFADKNPLCINTYTILSLSPGLSSTHHLQEEIQAELRIANNECCWGLGTSGVLYCEWQILLRPCNTAINVLLQQLSSESLEKWGTLCCSAFHESLWKPAFSGSPLKTDIH